jgi:hypothetical protein
MPAWPPTVRATWRSKPSKRSSPIVSDQVHPTLALASLVGSFGPKLCKSARCKISVGAKWERGLGVGGLKRCPQADLCDDPLLGCLGLGWPV